MAALAAAAPAQGADYVGLGDSYSSGTGTAGEYSGNCQRTPAAYPSLIDPSIPGSGVNLSCSGARTQHITTDAQGPENPVPQLNVAGAVNANTDVVTLQIGGNDAGFVDTLVACGNPFGDCDAAIAEAEQTATTELPPKLNAVYDAVRATAPAATIAVVGYPRIFRPNQSCNTFFSAAEVNDLNGAADTLSQLIQSLAQAKGLAYVDPRPAFIGHGACDSVEWINGLSFSQTANSYHPKAAGHSSGYAPLVLSSIQGIPETTITAKPPALSNTANPVFQFSSAPAAASFQCKLDSGAYTACISPRQYSGLSEGPHTIAVRGVNAAGNVDQFPDTHSWSIDVTAPGVAIDSGGPTGTVSDPAASFSFSSADGSAQLACRFDDAEFAPCSSPDTASGLGDGEHTFTVRATDPAGNVSTASRSWTVDTTAPLATVNGGPPDPTASTDATFEFNLDDDGASAECRLDTPAGAGEFEPCASGQAYSGLIQGEHSFRVRVTDGVGNTSTTDPYEWTVDSQASSVTIDSRPDPLTNDPTPEFTFTVDDPAASVDCAIDEGDFAPCSSGEAFGPLADGTRTFKVRATDLASNTATDSYTWTIDTQAPGAQISSGPPAASSQTAAQFEFTSADTEATFECRRDSELEGAFTYCISPASYASLGDGSHRFDVRAIDEAGNVGSHVSRAWVVDTVAPTVAIGAKPPAADDANSGQFAFSANEPGSTFECRSDSTAPGDFQPCSSPNPYSGLTDGSHTFDVRARDAVGNTGAVTSHTWTIDTTPPTASIDAGPPAISPTSGANFSFSSSEPGSSFECRLDSGEPSAFIGCVSPRSYSNLPDGPHTLEVRATDPVGNTGPTTAYAWNSDTIAPNAQIDSGPQQGSHVAATDAAFTFSASEPGDFQCRLDDGSFEGCAASKDYTGLAQGSHAFQVKFTDAGGRSVTDTRAWTVDTVSPVVQIDPLSGPAPVENSTSATFAFAVTGGAAPECRLDGGAFAPCASPRGYAGLDQGEHTFTVRSADEAGNVGQGERVWIVDTVAPDTSIISGPPTVTTSATASISFESDDPSAAFQCSLDGALFEACTSPQGLSGLGLGDHSFRVRAVDAAGNTDLASPAVHRWRIDAPEQSSPAPTGTSAPAPAVPTKPKCKKVRKGKTSRKRCKAKRKRR